MTIFQIMKLRIVTPAKLVLDQEVNSVTLPGSEGQMTILPMHAAMVATLKEGEMYYRTGEKISPKQTILGGFVEVLRDQVLVMTRASQTSVTGPSHH